MNDRSFRSESIGDGDGSPVVFMPSWRSFALAPFQVNRYEAQDVLCSVDSVDIVPLEPVSGFKWRERLLRRLMWYPPARVSALLNPGLREVRIQRKYDLFVAVCENPWELLYVNAVRGWEKNCRTSVLWLDELFVGLLRRYRHWLPTLDRFDHICLGHLASAEELSRILGRTCHWVPPAIDVLRFRPREFTQDRPITFLSIGRKHEGIHAELRRISDRQELFYVFDTLDGFSVMVKDPREHREMYAHKLRRSQFLLVGPGMMGEAEIEGEHIVGARFFEGAAAGTISIGERPNCKEYDILFDWRDSIIELNTDGTNAEEIVNGLLSDPLRMMRASTRGVAESCLRHDWVYRWRQIYEIAGLKPTAGMLQREQELRRTSEVFLQHSEKEEKTV